MTRKIAILGGGAGSLFAAWDLVHHEPDAYEITVYQLGWRLGGKGASGRNRADEPGADHRIEEHGLHLMFGFYENVFRVMREAYRECYGSDSAWQWFFKGEHTEVSMTKFLDPQHRDWEAWHVPYPTARPGDNDLPGDGAGATTGATVFAMLQNIWRWIAGLAKDTIGPGNRRMLAPAPPLDQLRRQIDQLETAGDGGVARAPTPYWRLALQFLERLLPVAPDPVEDARRFVTLMTRTIARLSHLSPAMRSLLRFAGAVARGLFADLFCRGSSDWFDLDRYDLRDWLERHGGDRAAPPVDGLYDAVFASYSKLGAGAILQAALKAAFCFRGSVIYKMQAGMGDTIFTPLYRALVAKGVRFAFFQRVERLGLSADRHTIETIELERQVDLADRFGYQPLVELPCALGELTTLQCWPSEPRWGQLPEAEVERVRGKLDLESHWVPSDPGRRHELRRDQDFDEVILGISVAALPHLCSELMAHDPGFERHVSALAGTTTPTQAMQLWSVPEKVPEQPKPLVVPNGDPYDTIAEMHQLLRAEHHPPDAVGGLHYLCSALYEDSPPAPRADASYPSQLLATARANGLDWLTNRAPILWRNLADKAGDFAWSSLHDPNGRAGAARFDAQFVEVPRNLSDRYVIPVPGSYPHRLRSNETVFDNLYLAGDWIRTSLSIGCLEAAAMGGLQAARALSLEKGAGTVPRAIGDWIDDVHPRPRATRSRLAAPAGAAYRRRDGELIAPPPYQLRCESLFVFVLRADRQRLQALCDRDLNLGGARYQPATGHVFLYAARLANLSLGVTCEADEVGLWLPVRSDTDALRIQTYSPYVWLDSATSMLVGRSIYGYPKQLAAVVVPKAGEARRIAVEGDAIVGTGALGGGGRQVRRVPLITVEGQPGTWAPPSGGVGGWITLAKDLTAAIGVDLLGATPQMSAVFLKQLAAPDGRGASYQAIVEAELRPHLDTVSGGPLPDSWIATVPARFEPTIVETLGLEAAFTYPHGLRTATLTPVAQFWLRFEARLGPGTERWRAP